MSAPKVESFWDESFVVEDISWPNGGGGGTAARGDTMYRLRELEIDGSVTAGEDWYGIIVEARTGSIRCYLSHTRWDDPMWGGTVEFATVAEAAQAFNDTVAANEEKGAH